MSLPSAIPGVLQLAFVAGDDVAVVWDITAADGVTPIDLTGCVADLTVRDAAGTAMLSVSSATTGELTVSGSSGRVSGYIPRAKTAGVAVTSDAPGGPRYSWALRVTGPTPAFRVTTFLSGNCHVLRGL